MRRIMLSCLLLVCVVGPFAFARRRPEQDTIKLYFDASRRMRQGSFLVSQEDGFTVTHSADILRSETLGHYDAVFIHNSAERVPYLPSELDAIRDFVSRGGGLLVNANAGDSLAAVREQPQLVPFSIPRMVKTRRPDNPPYSEGLRWGPLHPCPSGLLRTNEILGLFGLQLAIAQYKCQPFFARTTPPNPKIDYSLLAYEQIVTPVLCDRVKTIVLAQRYGKPTAVALQYGRGRIIVLGMGWLFDSIRGPKGKRHEVEEAQKELFIAWMQWLARGRASHGHTDFDYPREIGPPEVIETDLARFRFIPQYRSRADVLVASSERIWADFTQFLGLSGSDRTEKLEIHLRGSTRGGSVGPRKMSIAALGSPWMATAILAHEMGHTVLGGGAHAVTEGFADYLCIRGLRAVGYEEAAEEKWQKFLRTFEKADPKHNVMDVSDEAHEKYGSATKCKWVWILTELERKYGEDFFRKYLYHLHHSDKLEVTGPHHKKVNGKGERLTIDDIVYHFSLAAGEDLVPWFRGLGISVNPLN